MSARPSRRTSNAKATPAFAAFAPSSKRAKLEASQRNPAHISKDIADACGSVNPLSGQLYGDGFSSGAQVGAPNRLTNYQASTAGLVPHPPTSQSAGGATTDPTTASAATPAVGNVSRGRGGTHMVNSLQVFEAPKKSDAELRSIFAATTKSKSVSSRRPPAKTAAAATAPSKLVPPASQSRSAAVSDSALPTAAATAPKDFSATTAAEAAQRALATIPRFHKTTSNAPNEFVYLVMRPRGMRDPLNPYDLQPVPRTELRGKSYFTVSAAGVTHFNDSGAEFIELPKWERECRIFHTIRELPVFHDYQQWRNFVLWRNLVRHSATGSSRQFLSSHLFAAHPHLSGALLAVRKECLDTAAAEDLYESCTETRTLEAYTDALHAHLQEKKRRLEQMMKRIRDHVEQACKTAMFTWQVDRERQKMLYEDEEQQKKKAFDIRELGTQEQPSYIELTQRKAMCRRLAAFIKLCDYLVVECLTGLAGKAVTHLRHDLGVSGTASTGAAAAMTSGAGERSRKAAAASANAAAGAANLDFTGPLWNVEVVYNSDLQAIELVPSEAQIRESIEDIVGDYVRAVGAIPRLTSLGTFKVYTSNAQDELGNDTIGAGPDVAEMVMVEERYKNDVAAIQSTLSESFTKMRNHANTFERFKEMYITNSHLKREALLKRDDTLQFFRDQLATYKVQMEAISTKIPSCADVGMMRMWTEGLREFFTPSPVTCLGIYHQVLPIIAKRRNETLLKELQERTTYLAATPKTIEHYVEYVDYCNKLESSFDDIVNSYDLVRDLFSLMQNEKIEVNEEEEETYRSGTRPQFDKLRTLLQTTEDSKEAQQRFFSRSIEEEMDQLRRRIESVYDRAGQPIVMSGDAEVEEANAYMTSLLAEAEGIAAREKKLREFQIEIGAEETIVEVMNEMLNDVTIKARLWTGIGDWKTFTEETRVLPFDQLDVPAVQEVVQKFATLVKQVSSKLSNNRAVPRLRSSVEEWRQLLPVLQALTNPSLKSEHHAKISAVVGPIADANGTAKTLAEWSNQFTIEMLLEHRILKYRDEIAAVSSAATEEDKLQKQIDKVNAIWNGGGPKPPVEFQFHAHKDSKDVFTLVGSCVEDVTTMLDDSAVAISTIGSSKHCQGVLRSQVDRWENRFKYMLETLDKWVELQRSWIYLENIFSSSEIRSQWKDDAQRFEKVDRFYKDLMHKAHDLPTAYRSLLINPPSFDTAESTAAAGRTLKQDLDTYIKELEKVLLSLEKKLEEKRRAFPRFYFLSNDDLLDLLAKVKTPELMMPHMLKMFDGIKSLSLGSQNDITHLNSIEGETVELCNKGIKARGAVETWMDLLEREMFATLRFRAQRCLEDYEARDDRTEWMFQHPVQLVLIVEQLLWTRSVEEALDKQDSPQLMQSLRGEQRSNLEVLAELTARSLSRVQRVLLSTLITIDVHGRDLVEDMCESGVTESKEFGWTKQLRVYWEKNTDSNGTLFIRQNNSRFVYGYEYLGAQGRLVITPLTDRIYMTVTGALKLHLGASPAGPAGTGKTETVKDLAKNLARQCIVYNCSDGITYKMMEKFFSGLIQTGAWACLDEFNRINIEVLSVIASQLLEIKLALQNAQETFTFQGTPDVRVRPTYGAFVTMNPGYAGRTELPDNLKILFRPVACMTPDFRMIAEVILFSEGFKNAHDLSLKITQLYKLSSEQLSPQDHYDFGMRALKSILVMAGDLKRSQPDVEEDLTLIVACNDSNVPKFVAEDIPLFQGIMQDLFPGVSFPEREYEELLPAMQHIMDEKKLVDAGQWVKKGIQFYETLIVRHGVMLVGVTGTGKTEARRCIAGALTNMSAAKSANKMARPVEEYVINPKSILLHELYGQLDVNTNEWKDGVLAAIAKECVRASETSSNHRWMVFDGPVDTLWIESLNSVLDDSKLLCLDSGERIKLPETMHMLFEVGDLAVASPATVSRCGMVYVDAEDLPWRAVAEQWVETKLAQAGAQPQCRAYVLSLFDAHVEKGLEWLRQQRSAMLISAGDINVVQSLCDLFSALMQVNKVKLMADPQAVEDSFLPPDDPMFRERNEICNALFAFSYVWSIGGNVDQAAMESFDTMARTELEGAVRFPNYGSVYDYTVNFTTRLLVPWESLMPDFTYNPATPFFNVLVPTIDTVRYSSIAQTLLAAKKPVLFNGQTGVGKTFIMADCLRRNKEALQLSLVTFQFSAQTSSERTQELIEAKLKPKRKNLLGAAPGKSVVLFIDDLNMPAVEVFGASPPIELIRQLMGHGGFYDRKVAGMWKTVQDVTVVSACGPPEGGRNPITPRLTRLFHLLQIATLTDDSMKRIFRSILSGFLEAKNFPHEMKDLAPAVVRGSVDIFNRICDELRPRPTTPHYTFNLRDLSKVFQGITQVIPRVCRDAPTFVRLWVHELMRCFYDRLANPADRQFFVDEVLTDAVLHVLPSAASPAAASSPVLWADFTRFGSAEKVYEEVPAFNRIAQVLEEYQDDYNATAATAWTNDSAGVQTSQLGLVFFKDHCEHIARIIRILRQPRGNVLLVGVGGSGKRSLTRLATYISGCRIFETAVGKGYSMNDFHEFLLEVYTYAGVKNETCVLLLSDNQIVDEAMLEDVNNILNSGEVPSLFNAEEREKRISACADAAQQQGITSREEVYNFFIGRVRDNMHIALCMSPVGDQFRTRCRQFPSLTNCCSIDWFDEWPREALEGVAARMLEDLVDVVPADFHALLPHLCVDVHASTTHMAQQYYDELRRRYYITPTSYLEFIESYKALLLSQRSRVEAQLAQVENGTEKMRETEEMITKMKAEIEVKRPLLEKASTETQEVVVDLKVRQTKAAEVQVQVRAQQESATIQQRDASQIAAEANARLAEAKPIIDKAKAALDTIQASDLNELRSFANPPTAVLTTTQACMTMFDAKDFNGAWSGNMDWKGAREFLSYRPLLDMIRGYPTENVKPAILQKVQKFVNDPEFTVEVCSLKGSQTCGSLCAWVHAVNEYSKVVKEVAPMRQAAAEAEQHLAKTNAKLHAAQQQLKEVEKELTDLEQRYQISVTKKNDLEKGLQLCINRLRNAETLTGSLKSEGARWAENVKLLSAQLSALPLQVFMASACVAYFGAFTPAFRQRLIAEWKAELTSRGLEVGGFSLTSVLGDPVDTLNWQVNGLPSDETSTENAIVALLSCAPRRWPLFIDPQEQAMKWLLRQFQQTQPVSGSGAAASKNRNLLKVIKLTDATWMRTLESQIRLGGVVIIDDVGESLDPALEPLIARRLISSDAGGLQIQLTPQSGPIDYHPNFRLFLCSKLPNPVYLPDVSTRLTLLNFTVTMEGLSEQMLGEVVSIEQRAMEEEKNTMIQRIAQGQRRLKTIEENILERLQSTKGNILDDEDLIRELQSAQSNAAVISRSQEEANEKMAIISVARDKYRSVAVRAALLFFVLADVGRMDPMYQYSLQYFVKLVQHEIEGTVKPADYTESNAEMLSHHLSAAIANLTGATYTQICSGLFNKDKTILSLLIATAIARHDKVIAEEEWQYFVRASAFVAAELPEKPAQLSWMTRVQWELAEALNRTVPAFHELLESLQSQFDEWKAFAHSDVPHAATLPATWQADLNLFQRVLLIRCFREEKLFFALYDYVQQTMGPQFIEAPPMDLARTLKDSTPHTPIIFILSQGADPMEALQTLARTEDKELQYVSLGQGQSENARRLIASCRTSGAWALLQNCHLSQTFMPELSTIVASLQPGATNAVEMHPNFRLWLTSMPTDFFPVFVLQSSIKLTNEPPTGLRANMLRCFNELTPQEYDAFSDADTIGDEMKGRAFKKLLYGLCFFHSVVLERRKFGPLGWNVRYEWSDTDFHVSKQWLRLFFEEQEAIPWESLEYIIGQINYGGRVTDPQDRGILLTILCNYLSPRILKEGHRFCEEGVYAVPMSGTLAEAQQHIQAMSLVDEPAVFGMHENANLRYQLQTSEYLLNKIVSIQPRLVGSAGGSGATPEEEVCRKCQEFETTLPPLFTKEEAGPHTFTTLPNGLPNSLSTVLSHEIGKYNKLLSKISQTLSDMQKALQGLTVLSADLDAMYSSFLADQVPQLWTAVSYASLKPLGAWYRDLLARVHFIRTWVQKGEPAAFWIGGFFNPSAFMTGVYQAYARAESVSVDKLGFQYAVLDTAAAHAIKAAPERGCYVYGIQTDAWRWDSERRVMADSLPGEPYAELPPVHFLPEPYHVKPEDYHAVPLYRTTVRAGVISSLGASSNYVLSIEVPSADGSDYWLLKGAACVCALNQ
ncbi:putative dynein heavy chain [Leptomonas pyrrhocoris]|uniref:Putative dynein heavy chain n=1 Tax=Leptomonas pyrrhocoris TaxID=157538 RepID=A0A0N0VH71_LEPPY|nr:putative dynein heavy chain [Leptomonas pyrrhocoris]XP_015663520.1 putative dynein heavy chain [Leptomonas pyrrhocoris]KPA85080.1 putative dynein heavy chain [Leptomonas pyrrhocoris]KPA85081.1 putative dynein heavy chain [Leptomonas pyrrhocoris]|eukprot:XP_015663519.1 putative dynein heavy chain [Leptomonas pyrrhocoris]